MKSYLLSGTFSAHIPAATQEEAAAFLQDYYAKTNAFDLCLEIEHNEEETED